MPIRIRDLGSPVAAAFKRSLKLVRSFAGLHGNMVTGLIGLQVAMLNHAIFQHPAQGEMD